MKPITAVVLGAGSRGSSYAGYAKAHPDELQVIAVAEPREDRRDLLARELGIPEERIHIRTGICGEPACISVTDELLKLGVRHILTMDDDLCRFILNRLKQRNVRIPEDVQVASLYDSEQLENYNPPVSALQFDAAALGQVVCRELLRYLKGESYHPTPILGYQICMRGSTR